MGDPAFPAFQLAVKKSQVLSTIPVCPLKKALDPKGPLDPVKSHSKIFKIQIPF